MKQVEILKLDNFGRGICYIDDKITFVENTLPGEVVEVELRKVNKKYNEAKVINYLAKSGNRIESLCPFYEMCGGCNTEHLKYDDEILFKESKLEYIFKKFWNKEINVTKSDSEYGYRNKITLKIVNGNYGYYMDSSHKLVLIDDCLLASDAIRKVLKDINKFKINNGEIVIRSNYNDELLVWIKSDDDISFNIDEFKKHKIVGVVLNNKLLYGEESFVQIIDKKYYKVSYDSFFQVNLNVCEKIFNYISNYLDKDENVLDLYCGVGTLGIGVGDHVKKIYGIEIVPNAILNAISNSKVNKVDGYYLLGKCENCIDKINDDISTIIVDPPRAGLGSYTLSTIISFKPKKIIYVSCDPMTLARDLGTLTNEYKIIDLGGFDMFPRTSHIETVCILTRKEI